MAPRSEDGIWQTFVDQHQSLVALLDDHATLLVEMRQSYAKSVSILDLIQSRLVTTENLIATFKQSSETLKEATQQRDETPDDRHRPIYTKTFPDLSPSEQPIVDPSGLFAVDSNPSPVDQIHSVKPSTGGRVVGEKEQDASSGARDPDATSTPTTEKTKVSKPGPDQSWPTANADDSFLKAVEAKSRAKEERQLARKEKKRKRQSEGSSNGTSKGPTTKKQKQKHEVKRPASTPLELRQGPTSKQTKIDQHLNGSSKRPKPNENADGHGHGTLDSQPAKKRKKGHS